MEGHFEAADVGVLVLTLAISALIGIFFAIKQRNEENTEVYFHGSKNTSPFVIAMSSAVTGMSGLTMIGVPVEAYLFGTVWFWAVIGFPVAASITIIYFIPTYFSLKLGSVYEYLELRFCKQARIICSAFNIWTFIVYMSLTICYPALSLSALSSISLNWAIISTSALCTFYTAIGGFRSVIWADTFQAVIMMVASLTVLIKATMSVGGPMEVLEALKRGNRTTLWDFEIDPTKRNTVWSILIHDLTMWGIVLSTDQARVQRYLSCRNVRDSKKSLLIAIIPVALISICSILLGSVSYAYFEHCDPLLNNEIQRKDQLIPLLVSKSTAGLPGCVGLFVGAVYCGMLSTVSSGINTCSLLVMEDFVHWKWKTITKRGEIYLCKFMVLIFGITVCALSIILINLRGTIWQIGMALNSSMVSTVAGMFTLGLFIPWANSVGAILGSLSSFLITLWMSIGVAFYRNKGHEELIRMNDKCVNNSLYQMPNKTIHFNATVQYFGQTENEEMGFYLYNVSYMYLLFIGWILTVLLGVIISFASGATKPENVDPKLFIPLLTSKKFPEYVRNVLRCGVAQNQE